MKKRRLLRRLLLLLMILTGSVFARPQFSRHCQYDVGNRIGGMNSPMVVEDKDCTIHVERREDEVTVTVSSTWKAAQMLTSDKGTFVYDSSRHKNPYCDEPVVGIFVNAAVYSASYLWKSDFDFDQVTFVATCANWNRSGQSSVTIDMKRTKNVVQTQIPPLVEKENEMRLQFRLKEGVRLSDKTAINTAYHNVYYVCQTFDMRPFQERDVIGFRALEDKSENGSQFIRGPVVEDNLKEPERTSLLTLPLSRRSRTNNKFVHHAVVFAWYSEEELESTTKVRGFPGLDVDSPFMCRFFPYKRLMWAWSGGGNSSILRLPENVSFPMPLYITIQAHYMIPIREGKNQNRNVGIQASNSITTDRFGIELVVSLDSSSSSSNTPKRRAGYMVLGSRVDRMLSSEIFVPRKKNKFKHRSSCYGSTCDSPWPHRIYLTGLLFHTHFLGRELQFVSIEENRTSVLASAHVGSERFNNTLVEFLNWDPSKNPTMSMVEIPVKPHDRLALTCTYDSSSRDFDTRGGLGALDEMCWIFAFYYDRFETEFTVDLIQHQKNSDGCCFTAGNTAPQKFYPPLLLSDSKALQYDIIDDSTSLSSSDDFSPFHLLTTQAYVRQSGGGVESFEFNFYILVIAVFLVGLLLTRVYYRPRHCMKLW